MVQESEIINFLLDIREGLKRSKIWKLYDYNCFYFNL